MLIFPVVKKYILSPRLYHTTSRYDGYWNLLLQQPTRKNDMPLPVTKTFTGQDPVCLDTTSNDHDALTNDSTPIGDAPVETIVTDQEEEETSPSFVWLQNEKIPLPDKPPPPENCCMSGCAYCVYDIYQEDMEAYKHQMKELRQRFHTAGIDLPETLMTKKMKESSSAQIQPDDDDDEEDDDGMDPTMKAFLEMEKKLNANS